MCVLCCYVVCLVAGLFGWMIVCVFVGGGVFVLLLCVLCVFVCVFVCVCVCVVVLLRCCVVVGVCVLFV